MKKICLLVPLLFVSAFAHWVNTSEQLIPSEKILDSTYTYAFCGAHRKIAFTFGSQKTSKWKVRTLDPSCTLSIVKGETVIKSFTVANGSFTFKQLLGPGSYTVRSTADIRISLYEWRPEKMKTVVPVGGGILAPIVINDKKATYFRAAADTIPVFKIKGPVKAFIYIRADVPEKEKFKTIDVTIADKADGKVLVHKTASKYRSKKSMYADRKGVVPSQALIVTVDIPKGYHEYALALKGVHGAVRFYTENPKRKAAYRRQRVIRW